jgi:colanic acid/amylovoran biosynthesis glycosyltransferase
MIKKNISVVHYRYICFELTEQWIYNQVRALDNIEIKVYAVVRNNENIFPFQNFRYLIRNSNLLNIFLNQICKKFFNFYPYIFLFWFYKDRPDLIHAHFGTDGYSMLGCSKRLRIPLITSFYGFDAYQVPQKAPQWQKRYRKLFEEGDIFLVEGPAMQQKLIHLGCPQHKIIIHHIGIHLKDYRFCVRRPTNEIKLLVCGRFVQKKGIPYAIEALKIIKSKNNKISICLTIVGDSDEKGSLTDEKKKILDRIKSYNLKKDVILMGYVNHSKLLDIIYTHDIFISPSIHASNGDAEGGFPVILTEVLATGMLVVAFDHCDIKQVIRDRETGFLVPEGDVTSLADKILYFVEHPEIWGKMGRAGRNLIENNYDLFKLNNSLIRIYETHKNKHSYMRPYGEINNTQDTLHRG